MTDVNEGAQRYVDQVFSGVDVQRGLSYAPGRSMDVFTPSGDTATGRPLLILAAGGGFQSVDRTAIESTARDFARRGYVTVSIDYSLLSGPPISADELAVAVITATHDMFAAIRFFRADALSGNTYDLNPDTIFVGGESAGAVMAAIVATLDPSDTISSSAVANYLSANGGAYGNIGSNTSTASSVSGALALSGAVLDLSTVDASSSILYAAHEEFDPIVPCQTAPEGSSFTGLVVSGGCVLVPAYNAAGATAELFLVAGSAGHVDYSDAQLASIYQGAATLFFNQVISVP
ncbi:MAG: alpha/beta hydrolase [Henriciella sp.]|nr:alpha/beta hydrolase [Henriciella sp.]